MANLSQISAIIQEAFKKRTKYELIGVGVVGVFMMNYIYKFIYHRIYSLPNGPYGLPLMNNILLMINQRKLMMKLAPSYGVVSIFYGGPKALIYLNSYESITKVLKHKDVLYRETLINEERRKKAGKSLLHLNGNEWALRRKFSQQALFTLMDTDFVDKIFGKILNDNIIPGITECIHNGKLWFPREYLHSLSFNVIYAASFGKIISSNDPSYIEYRKTSDIMMDGAAVWALVQALPNFVGNILKLIPTIKHSIDTNNDCGDKLLKIEEMWLNSVLGYDNDVWIKEPGNNKYYQRIRNIGDKEDSCFIEKMIYNYHFSNIGLSKLDVFADFLLFLVAGKDTTQYTMEYGLTYLAKYPVLQELLYKELKIVFKSKSDINMRQNIKKLHIFRAFIREILRLSSIAPFGFPRKNIKSITIDMFDDILNKDIKVTIPKNSLIFGNIPYVNNHSLYWTKYKTNINSDLDIFGDMKLSAWLDNNKQFKVNTNFVTFSVGKRDCVGRTLALKELQCFFAHIIIGYKFDINNNDNKNKSIGQAWGIVRKQSPQIGLMITKR